MRILADYKFTREDGMLFNGERAGCINDRGYRLVYADGKSYLEHRLIWEHFNGKIPVGYELHHKNSVKDSNALSNLMCMTLSEHQKLDQRSTNPSLETRERMRAAKLGKHQSVVTRAKSSAARMGKQCGSGAHPSQVPSGNWRAMFGYRGGKFHLGTCPTEAAAQTLLDAARAFANTKPSLAEFEQRMRT